MRSKTTIITFSHGLWLAHRRRGQRRRPRDRHAGAVPYVGRFHLPLAHLQKTFR